MKRRGAAAVLCVTVVIASAGRADEPRKKRPEGSIWPSPRLIDLFLRKVAADMANDYGFDEYQRDEAERVLRERIGKFLEENRPQLEKLVTEFLEAQVADEPPDPQFVAEWAKRAQPLLAKAHDLLYDVADDMRDFMTDEQQIQLDGYLAAFDVGVEMTQKRLQRWAAGEFDPQTEWVGNPQARKLDRQRRREMYQRMEQARSEVLQQYEGGGEAAAGGGLAPGERARAGAEARKARQARGATDAWERYVEQFIARYQLDAQQQQKARLFLRRQREARDTYLARKAGQMERIEKLYKQAKTPEQVQQAEAEYKKLMAPVERMFEVLKSKLETLPTRAQRRAAAKREIEEKPAPAKP